MNYLYGKLSKEVTPIKYSGKETSTATVVVDNVSNTIEVNVKQLTELLSIVDGLQQRVLQLETLINQG